VPPKNTLVFVSCSVTWKHDVIHKNRKYVNTLHCRHKSTKPRPHVTCTENLVKHGCEICERTDRQTDRHAGRNTSTSTCFTSHSMSGVMSAVHYDTCCPSDQTTHLSVDTWWMNDRITSPPWLADMIHSAVCVCVCVCLCVCVCAMFQRWRVQWTINWLLWLLLTWHAISRRAL